MRRVIITPPTWEPVTLAEAKTSLRVASNTPADDEMITNWIVAARERVETMIGITLPATTFDVCWDAFPAAVRGYSLGAEGGPGRSVALASEPIVVPYPPLTSVTWLKYLDTNETLQTVSSLSYRVSSGGRMPGRVVPASNTAWPTTAATVDAVQLRVVAGYSSREATPMCAKQAILLLVQKAYDNPDIDHGSMEQAVKDVLRPLNHGRYF